MIRPVCIIGVLEYRYQSCDNGLSSNIVVNKNILDYFNVKKYFRTYVKKETNNNIAKSVRTYLTTIQNSVLRRHTADSSKYGDIELLYGIEIDCIGVSNGCPDSTFEKELAEHNMSNFIKFMYDHRGVEFDTQTELMALEIDDVDVDGDVDSVEDDNLLLPEDLYNVECNIQIKLVKVENMTTSHSSSVIYNLSREINKEFCLYIAKAGFKLNMNSILDPGKDPGFENCRLQFNIYACKKIKPWIHAMKRKIKKKFHIIEKFEYTVSEIYGSDVENWSITNSVESLV